MNIQRTYYEIGSKITDMLKNAGYEKDQKLPSERELSEMFGASRATIREALVMLEVKGVVSVKKGSGIFYNGSSISSNAVLDIDCDTMNNHSIGPFELIKAREVIETSIVEFAATQIKLEELRKLKEIIELQERDIYLGAEIFERRDREFHEMIARSTQNKVLIYLESYLWTNARTKNRLWQDLNARYLQQPEKIPASIQGHKNIYIALQRRDPQAAKVAFLDHLENSRKDLIEALNSEGICLDDYEDAYFASLKWRE